MSILSRVILLAILIFGVPAIIGRLHIADRTRHIEHKWAGCTNKTAMRGLEQDLALNSEELLKSILSECRAQFGEALASCESEIGCEERLRRTALERIGMIREELAWAREEAWKRGTIERAIMQFGKDGISRDDLKAFFRDEILEEEAADKTAEMEARASGPADAEPFVRP